MRRRSFISLVGGAAVWPLAVVAQQPAMPVIGYLHGGSPEMARSQVAAFRRGLNEVGFIEGRNVAVEYRWANGEYNRLPELIADLIQRRVAVLAAPSGTDTARAAKPLTTTIPIVFSTSVDPVLSGLVASLNRPGSNITGITDMGRDVGAKQFGLLQELLPSATHFAVLISARSALAESLLKEVRTAATTVGKEIEVLTVGTNLDVDAAFTSLAKKNDPMHSW